MKLWGQWRRDVLGGEFSYETSKSDEIGLISLTRIFSCLSFAVPSRNNNMVGKISNPSASIVFASILSTEISAYRYHIADYWGREQRKPDGKANTKVVYGIFEYAA